MHRRRGARHIDDVTIRDIAAAYDMLRLVTSDDMQQRGLCSKRKRKARMRIKHQRISLRSGRPHVHVLSTESPSPTPSYTHIPAHASPACPPRPRLHSTHMAPPRTRSCVHTHTRTSYIVHLHLGLDPRHAAHTCVSLAHKHKALGARSTAQYYVLRSAGARTRTRRHGAGSRQAVARIRGGSGSDHPAPAGP